MYSNRLKVLVILKNIFKKVVYKKYTYIIKTFILYKKTISATRMDICYILNVLRIFIKHMYIYIYIYI